MERCDGGAESHHDRPHIVVVGSVAGEAQPCHPAGQVTTVGVLEHQERLSPLGLTQVVHGDDVRMLHPPQDAPFGDEPLSHLGVEAVVLSQHLDGHHVV